MSPPQSLRVNLAAFGNVSVCALQVEQAVVAFATQVQSLSVVPCILQYSRQGHDGVKKESLMDLAHSDVDVTLQDQMVRICSLLEADVFGSCLLFGAETIVEE